MNLFAHLNKDHVNDIIYLIQTFLAGQNTQTVQLASDKLNA